MDFSKVKNLAIPEGNVTSISIGGKVVWKKPEEPPAVNSFYIEDASGQPNTLSLTQTGAVPVKLEYSTDNKVWQEWIDCQTTTLPVAANSKVYLRGTNNVFSEDYKNNNKFNCTGEFNVGGDLTTLLVPEGNVLDLTGRNFIFHSLFIQSNVIDAGKLILPAATLANNCYEYMFYNCTSLTTAPELPATTLADNCYGSMFSGCSSLQTAPELPATILANTCYYNMFKGCTSLTKVPDLLATTLAPGCCRNMFRDCTSLTTAPVLPVTELANECYNGMFSGCTSLTTAPELPATKLTVKGYYDMFSGCTSLTTAPELPATELAKDCYNKMFQNCTSLIQAPVLPAMTLSRGCYYDMFSGCGKLNYVKIGTTTWNNIYAYRWLSGTAATGTIEIPAELVTWDGTGTQPEGSIPLNSVNGVPTGWIAKKPQPVIPPQEPVTTQSFRFKNVDTKPVRIGYLAVLWGNPNMEKTKFIYSKDEGSTWNWWERNDPNWFKPIELGIGETIYIRGVGNTVLSDPEQNGNNRFDLVGKLECHGNITDLATTDSYDYQYAGILSSSHIVTLPDIPKTSIKSYMLAGLFSACSEITSIPKEYMPKSFTDGAVHECDRMFSACSNLVTDTDVDIIANPHEGSYESLFEKSSNVSKINILCTKWNSIASKNWLKDAATVGNMNSKILKIDDLGAGVGGCPEGWTFNGEEIKDRRFRFVNVSGSENTLSKVGRPLGGTVQYSTDYVNWQDFYSYTMQPNEVVYLKGDMTATAENHYGDYYHFTSTQPIECYGNISDLRAGRKECTEAFAFKGLFKDMTTLLTTPDLDITKLSPSCFRETFRGCTSLREAVVLPKVDFADSCYVFIMSNCTSLTKTSVIPNVKFAQYALNGMFSGCTNINYAKVECTSWSNKDASDWLSSTQVLGTFVKPEALQIGDADGQIEMGVGKNNGIPLNWTVENV